MEHKVQTLKIQEQPKEKTNSDAFEKAFGLWRNRDIDLETIRQKAWRLNDNKLPV